MELNSSTHRLVLDPHDPAARLCFFSFEHKIVQFRKQPLQGLAVRSLRSAQADGSPDLKDRVKH